MCLANDEKHAIICSKLGKVNLINLENMYVIPNISFQLLKDVRMF